MHIHATCVEVNGKGVLILGEPGAGKSSLGLQLIDRGATLVADDQTHLRLAEGVLVASPVQNIQGMIEVRGIGLCSLPFKNETIIGLCIQMANYSSIERLPKEESIAYYGIRVPLIKLSKEDSLGALKVELKLNLERIIHDS